MQCEPCGTTFFCSGGARFACPDHSITEFSHENNSPSDVEDCVCLPGYLRVNNTCVLGEPGAFYFQQGLPMPCPQHKLTYSEGASLLSQCRCVPGYYTLNDASCEPCAADTYNSLPDQEQCESCPLLSSHSRMASSAVTDCVCDAGAFRQQHAPGACQLCASGTFKGVVGPAACEPCAINTFSNGLGASACLACHAQSEAPERSGERSDCECVAGYQDRGGAACDACVVGKMKMVVSHDACELCAAGSFQNQTAQSVCLACGVSSTSEPERGFCECDAGHTSSHPGVLVSAPMCEPCAADTYKEALGPAACDACGTFMRSPAAAVLQTQCLCNEGYFFTGFYDTCEGCAPGTFKATVSNGAPETDCVACPADSFSGLASTNVSDCSCNAGFTPGIYQEGCNYCDPGYFKEAPGPELCESCTAGTFNPHLNATRCLDCYAGADSPATSIALQACLCAAGFDLNETAFACDSCPAGSSNGAEGGRCAACANGTFSAAAASTACSVCEALSASYASPRTFCECDAGYDALQTCPANSSCLRCRACPADFFKDTHGDAGCEECQANSESDAASVPQSSCRCSVGFSQLGEAECAACEPGFFSDSLDAEVCELCGERRFANVSAMSECHYCWPDSESNDNHTGCDCNPGFAPDGEFACAPCAANTYKETRGNTACLACRADSQSAMESFLVEHCECNAGFELLGTTQAGACAACGIGMYRPVASNEPCWMCASTLTTEFNQSETVEQCVCAPGLQFNTNGACEACPANTFSFTFSRAACEPCRNNSVSRVQDAADDEFDCLCDTGYDDHPRTEDTPRECEACAAGLSKANVSNAACEACAIDYFAASFASTECDECGLHSSTHGDTGRALCDCVVGFARRGSTESECETCVTGKFKDDFRNTDCSECQLCLLDEEVTRECNSSHPIACASCPAHSSTLGRRRALIEACACDAGYEYDGSSCVACKPGTFKEHTNNSLACAACVSGEFTTTPASTSCNECSAHCEEVLQVASYVGLECNASRDVVCAPCTVCAPGTFSQPVCGVASGNDRNDTVCAVCTPGFFCPGAGVRTLCPGGSESDAGSNSSADCGCVLGYATFIQDGGCLPCGFDTYCRGGLLTDCPAHSLTLGVQNSVIHDCICLKGFYKVVQPAVPADSLADNFSCAVCTIDDFCANNSVFNCSDERMRSVAGSSEAADCRCVNGFYNSADHTRCLPCERDHYCVDGNIFACAEDQWTQGQTRQDVCTCRPGLRAADDACLPCGLGSFCIGDDHAQTCRAHSVTLGPNAEAYHDCLCQIGFGDLGGAASLCLPCQAGNTFQDSVGNFPCGNCTRCSGASGLFTSVWCSAGSDALCDACDACDGAEQYTHRACADFANSECRACAQCDFVSELELLPCQTYQNRECRVFEGSVASCAPGFYRGGHTEVSDSYCIPCRYNDTLLNGQSLHAAHTFGRVYNDPFSCEVTCLGNSRLRDATKPFLGCLSCETGNVLLKVFPVDMAQATTCAFTCRPGYERVRMPDGTDDCYVARLLSSPRSEFFHSVSVGDFSLVNNSARLRLSHTSHGFFAIVLGRTPPTDCKLGATASFCCFAQLWRVSTLAQMGLVSAQPGACVGQAGVPGTRISSHALELDISDSMLPVVARCTNRDEVRVCVLVVSLIDTITWRTVSTTFELRTTRAVTVAFAPRGGALTQMLPLSQLDVQVSLMRRLASGEHIFQVQTAARGTAMIVTTRVVGMVQLAVADLALRLGDCDRVSHENGSTVTESPTSQLFANVSSSTLSYWQAGAAVPVVKVLLTLQQAGDERDVMDVAAVRDVRLMQPTCGPGVHEAQFFVGQVWAIAGLGAEAVSRMQLLGPAAASGTARGKLDSLLTFIAESTVARSPPLRLRRILAVHLRGPAPPAELANTTLVRAGVRDFTPAFRQWCFAAPATCHLEYISPLHARSNVLQLASCNATHQLLAVQWLRTNYGVVHDAGHVAAVCAAQRAMLPFSSQTVLLNTMQYASRQAGRWNTNQDPQAAAIRSRVWVDFELTET